MANYYNQYRNSLYNPDEDDRKPGLNDNWKQIQKGFYQVEAQQEAQDSRMTEIENVNTTQDNRLSAVENKNSAQDTRLDAIEDDLSSGPVVHKMTLDFTGMEAIAAGDDGGIDMLIAEGDADFLGNYEGADTFLIIAGVRATASYTGLIPGPVRVKIAAELPVNYNVVTKAQITAGVTVGMWFTNTSSQPITIADDTLSVDFYFIPVGGLA